MPMRIGAYAVDRAYLGTDVVTAIVNSGVDVLGANGFFPGIAESSLYLPLTNTIVPTRGSSTPTFTRATAAWDFDSEGKLNLNIPSGGVRFTGARFVRNLISSKSEDFTNASWGAYRIVPNAGKIIPDNTLGGHRFYQTVANVAGTFALSVDAKAAELSKLCLAIATSAEAVQHRAIYDLVNVTATTDAGSGPTPTIVSLGSGWYRCSITGTTTSAASGTGVFIYAANAAGETTFTGNNTDGILVTKVQWENVSGQADQTASEYVSVGVLSSPYHGAGVDGCKWFNTNKDGSAISAATLKGHNAEPTRINNCYYSRNMRSGEWRGVQGSGADLFSDASTTFIGESSKVSPGVYRLYTSTGAYSAIVFAGVTAGVRYSINFTVDSVAVAGGGYLMEGISVYAVNAISPNPGAYTLTGVASGTTIGIKRSATAMDIQISGVSIKASNIQVTTATGLDNVANSASRLTAAASDATLLQLLTAATGSRTFSAWIKRVSGSGTISLTRNGGTGWTDITSSLVTGTWVPVELVSDVGANPTVGLKMGTSGDVIEVDCCQDENGAWRTSPILTTTAAVTRNADVLSYANAFDVTQGTAACSCSSQSPVNTGDIYFLGGDTNGRIVYTNSVNARTQSFCYDGTNIAQVTTGQSLNTGTRKRASRWGSSTLRMCADGNLGSSQSFDGALGATTTLYVGSTAGGVSQPSGNIGEVHIWNTPLTDAQMQQVTQP